MKWYNKTRSKSVDLGKVSFWNYVAEETHAEQAKASRDKYGYYTGPTKSYLEVVIDGCVREFEGEEADELYRILKTQKEVL